MGVLNVSILQNRHLVGSSSPLSSQLPIASCPFYPSSLTVQRQKNHIAFIPMWLADSTPRSVFKVHLLSWYVTGFPSLPGWTVLPWDFQILDLVKVLPWSHPLCSASFQNSFHAVRATGPLPSLTLSCLSLSLGLHSNPSRSYLSSTNERNQVPWTLHSMFKPQSLKVQQPGRA